MDIPYRARPHCYKLPSSVGRVFESARSFRTLGDHTSAAVSLLRISESDAAQVAQLFRDFATRGMLISEGEFLRSLHTGPGQDSPDSIASISVIANSEVQARKTLHSTVAHLERIGRKTAVQALVAEDLTLADNLIATGLDPGVVAFALVDDEEIGWAGGANRNRWLLLTQGELAFSCDDDIVWQVFGQPAGEEVALGSLRASVPVPYASLHDTQNAATEASDIDFLAAHEKLLGRNVRQVLHDRCWLDPDVPISDNLLMAVMNGCGRIMIKSTAYKGRRATGDVLPVAMKEMRMPCAVSGIQGVVALEYSRKEQQK